MVERHGLAAILKNIMLIIGMIMLLFSYVDRQFSFYGQPIPRLSVAFWPA
jgi:hypothetical protein